jgi:hypothetical protein
MLPHIIEESLSCFFWTASAHGTVNHQAQKHASKHQKTKDALPEACIFICFLESGEVNRCTTGEIDGEP